jgi:predicted DNA-binding protein YlxM (UPF0122 family)
MGIVLEKRGVEVEKRVALNWLMDFYGPLLTENRARLLKLYCEEDLTLSELALEAGITRQGVHDALTKAQAQLEEYERKLGLVARYRRLEDAIRDCRKALSGVVPTEATRARLEEARRALDAIERIET